MPVCKDDISIKSRDWVTVGTAIDFLICVTAPHWPTIKSTFPKFTFKVGEPGI